MITIKSDAVKNAFYKLAAQVDGLSGTMLKAAQLINSVIKQRVQKGVGLNGKMPGYSPAYKKWKKKKGRQVSSRDLTFSGKMLASLTEALIGKNSVRLFFGSADEQKKAMGNTEVAPFFGMTKIEDAIYDKYRKDLLKSIHL